MPGSRLSLVHLVLPEKSSRALTYRRRRRLVPPEPDTMPSCRCSTSWFERAWPDLWYVTKTQANL